MTVASVIGEPPPLGVAMIVTGTPGFKPRTCSSTFLPFWTRDGDTPTTLRTLADLTAGAVVEAGDVATIPGRLATGSIETRRQVDDDIWDTWPVLALLVGLYCTDIAIRRLSGLS